MKFEKHKKYGRHVLELYPQTEYHCGKIIWDCGAIEIRFIKSLQSPATVSSEYTGYLRMGRDQVVGGWSGSPR